ncbi:hypothetical protein ACJ72_01190 [Emergomyces africanus]|uniref:Uncharacterized protein n=1 Tax=Emergomyces africanus TaxID=1955775 RepID=A0A1B7P5Y8_9EURO|nr:hypothetical protein ACJ72_01190 [Emergomyces africanus]
MDSTSPPPGKNSDASGNFEVSPPNTQNEVYNNPVKDENSKVPNSGNIDIVPASTEKEVSDSREDNPHNEVHIDRSSASGNIEEANRPKTYLKFQVEKSSALGLILPLNLQLTICNETSKASSPAFVTTEMHWVDIVSVLPPLFSLYPVSNTGTPEKDAARVVNFSPRGWQGVTGMKAHLDLVENGDAGLPSRKWAITRSGWTRHYKMEEEVPSVPSPSTPKQFVWKGSMEILDHLVDTAPRCRGNLKLETQDGSTLLAAWKQRRDDRIMGSFTIFEASRDLIPVEVIVGSGIAVVMAERASGVNFLGGIGK